jgi:argininosuccinate lyase
VSQLWGGRFEKELSREVAKLTSSLEQDARLWKSDIAGSIAHTRMLGRQGIVSTEESEVMIHGLESVAKEIEAMGPQIFGSTAEDVHSEIERLLKEKIGAVAGKLHTARSRNDQVATATRHYMAHEVRGLQDEILALQKWILAQAEEEKETLLPGLTHFQHAQPVSLAHHLLTYFWMLDRDRERLGEWMRRTLQMPLGSAALAGTSFTIDRESVARELGFEGLCENSLDAVSDRDFAIEFLADASILMMHLSRWCEELVIWSGPEHGFITLDDSVTTGSSIMPQKKNPDIAELIRGRTGRAFGALTGLLTVMKGLPLAYNRDMQEDKFHLFHGLDTVVTSVRLMRQMLATAKFDRERMRASLKGDFSNATDLADDLAAKGVPFREAHEIVGRVVLFCLKEGRRLENLKLSELQEFHPLIGDGTIQKLDHQRVAEARRSRGGTSPAAVTEQIGYARMRIHLKTGETK